MFHRRDPGSMQFSQPKLSRKSFDAPAKTWGHRVLFNLPVQTRELAEGVPTTETLASGANQGKNDFGNIGYGGPAPPTENRTGTHRNYGQTSLRAR
jgi:phosphatidylethanolamine-binding protein (PEBP) family uncharacterized protein